MRSEQPGTTIRVAAAGDIHCRESRRGRIEEAFAELGADPTSSRISLSSRVR